MLWTYDKGTAYLVSPILYDGLLYLVTDESDGRLLRVVPKR